MFFAAPVAVAASKVTDDHAPTEWAGGFVVGGVYAIVPDVGVCEGDDLTGVGRIGDDLLVAGQNSVEHHFTSGHSAGGIGADPLPFEDFAVGQHELVLANVAHRVALPSCTTRSPL